MTRQWDARLRYPRIAAALSALTVTLVAVFGGIGVLPSVGESAIAAAPSKLDGSPATRAPAVRAPAVREPAVREPAADISAGVVSVDRADELPAASGNGKRVVFSMGRQRVWLVSGSGVVSRSYLVSGSITDNLSPGTYAVFSKSRRAVGIDDSGTMGYMVRFAHGANAAIGFHDIPVLDGRQVQTRRDLGTPRSHGCIRQSRPNAKALWDFTEVSTQVVVLA